MRPNSSVAKLVASYQLNRVAAVACCTCHEGDLGVVSANEHYSDVSGLKLIDFGPIVFLPRDVSLEDRFSQATTVELLLGLLGDTLPEDRVVVEDRDLLVGPMIRHVVGGHEAERIVAMQ